MRLSELIAEAQRALAEHGDMELVKGTEGCGYCDPAPYVPAEASTETVEVWFAADDKMKNQRVFVVD